MAAPGKVLRARKTSAAAPGVVTTSRGERVTVSCSPVDQVLAVTVGLAELDEDPAQHQADGGGVARRQVQGAPRRLAADEGGDQLALSQVPGGEAEAAVAPGGGAVGGAGDLHVGEGDGLSRSVHDLSLHDGQVLGVDGGGEAGARRGGR